MADQDMITVQTRVTRDVYAALDAWARREDRSLASLLRLIIVEALEGERCGSRSAS